MKDNSIDFSNLNLTRKKSKSKPTGPASKPKRFKRNQNTIVKAADKML